MGTPKFEDACYAPLPADFEQAIAEVLALRKILKRERECWLKATMQREKFRQELSAMASNKDKEISKLRAQLKSNTQ
jgi:hypothetical protein